MSRKLAEIPFIENYEQIQEEMYADFQYRVHNRRHRTLFGNPLYERINVQVITTQECPYHCPFCLERQHPMEGKQDFSAQMKSLILVLKEHQNARVTITGGEPTLYLNHIVALHRCYAMLSNNVFFSLNTAGYNPNIYDYFQDKKNTKVNLSVNEYTFPYIDQDEIKDCVLQTVIEDPMMHIDHLKAYMEQTETGNTEFSFRFLSEMKEKIYTVDIWNELQRDPEIDVHTFRIGDFFVYATFGYKQYHARVTLGDMWVQQNNDYKDSYSNIIIHPDGKIGLNWR